MENPVGRPPIFGPQNDPNRPRRHVGRPRKLRQDPPPQQEEDEDPPPPQKKRKTKTPEKKFSCHQCHHQHPESKIIPCSKGNCVLKYGVGCLESHYDGEIVPEDSISTWECPRCRKICNCTDCKKFIPYQEAIDDLGVQIDAMKTKQEESKATILSLQATLANVESQKIALEKELLMVKRKDRDKKIIANMLDALSKCVQTFGLHENQARSILDEIKQAITAGASRKGERAETTNTKDFGAEPEEEKQVVEVLGSLVKILKASFLPSIDELSSYLMPMLAKDKTAEERRNAIRAFDDVADQCPEAEYHSVFAFWFSYYEKYLPSLLEACNDESSDVRQAAVYGIGVCAEHGGSVIKPLIGEALSRLNAVIMDPNALLPDNVMAYDNAVSALGKICYFHRDSIDLAQVIPVWLNCLPIKGDVVEAKAVHDLLSVMVERSDAELLGLNNQYLPKIFSIFAEILFAGKDLASDQTRCRIIEILRQFQQMLPPATLASIWSTLQPQQQSALQSILSS